MNRAKIIPLRTLAALPIRTLEMMALAAALDIDNGEDKRDVLENIMRAIADHPS